MCFNVLQYCICGLLDTHATAQHDHAFLKPLEHTICHLAACTQCRASTTNLHIAKSTEPCLLSGGVAPCLLTLLLPHICCMCTAILAQPGLHLDYFTQRCCSTCARVQQIRQCCLTTYAHCNTQQNRQYSTASLQLCQLFQQERTVGTDGLAMMGHLD